MGTSKPSCKVDEDGICVPNKFETKYVDFYGDGSKGGHFIKIEGTFSVSAGAAEAK